MTKLAGSIHLLLAFAPASAQPMKIATWNINGIKARIEAATTWLKSASPDIACLQEIKCVDEAFPSFEFEALGYNVAVHGQKGFNGVALLSKLPFDEVTPRLAGDPDDVQARYLEAVISVPSGALRLINIYLPNGNPFGSEKYVYKLAWMTRLKERIKTLLLERGDDGHRRRLQRHPDARGRLQPERLDGRRAVQRPRRARISSRWSISA